VTADYFEVQIALLSGDAPPEQWTVNSRIMPVAVQALQFTSGGSFVKDIRIGGGAATCP